MNRILAQSRIDLPGRLGNERSAQRIFEDVLQLKGLFLIKLTGDLAAAGHDRIINSRSGIKLAVQNNGQALADIIFGDFAKLLSALGIESEIDLWLAKIAAHDHGALDAADHFRT